VAAEDRELRRAMAKASLRAGWDLAEKSGLSATSDDEIDREIDQVRGRRRKAG
jgi:hypothetical protein